MLDFRVSYKDFSFFLSDMRRDCFEYRFKIILFYFKMIFSCYVENRYVKGSGMKVSQEFIKII